MKHFALLLLICALAGIAGCKKNKDATRKNVSGSGNSRPVTTDQFDACSLITNQEVEAIEGSPVKNTKPSGNANGGLRFAQCFYTTAEFSRSVSLAATLTDSSKGSGRSVRQYWEDTFRKYEKEEKETAEPEADKEKRESLREEKRGEEENEGAPPKKITGIGDEAYWLGNRVGGALYVLKNDVLLRISVGGPDPEQGKIDKCKALAGKALNRL